MTKNDWGHKIDLLRINESTNFYFIIQIMQYVPGIQGKTECISWNDMTTNTFCSAHHQLGYVRVYLPLCGVADTPFHIQGEHILA